MHDQVLNEFVLDSGTDSGTDWVVTFPTKRFYLANPPSTGPAMYLFQRNFNGNAGSCDDVTLELFDREEFKAQGSFSPPPPSADELAVLGSERDYVQQQPGAGLDEQPERADDVPGRLDEPGLLPAEHHGNAPPAHQPVEHGDHRHRWHYLYR